MDASRVAVVGAGTMGVGIAQIAAEAGHRVTLIDTDQAALDRALATIDSVLIRKVEKDRATQAEADQTKTLLQTSTDMTTGVIDAEMVVEAVFENLELKQQVFRDLDRACLPQAILASNTSTLPISDIAAATAHPERVIGTHYFSPVPLMRLVEVVRGDQTSDAVAERTVELCRGFGKSPILIADVPGFIVNRFLCLLYNEAANMIHHGVATAEDIDAAMKLGCNWPMGITEIMDLAGVDVTLNAMEAMHEMTGEDRYDPSPLLRQMVADNKLGRKTGHGFYDHT